MRLCEVNLGQDRTAGILPRHRVQFYKDDEFLLAAVAEHLANSLICDGLAVGFLTPQHGAEIRDRLLQAGVSAEALEKRCILIDAAEGLARFMRQGVPDRQLFNSMLGELLVTRDPWSSHGAGFAAFGEMVAVLWAEGKREAAIQLEQLWTEFTNSHPVSLLCAYPLSYFSRADDRDLFSQVCAHHSSVAPAETFLADIAADDLAREVAELQQRAEALAQEVEARKQAEERVRATRSELEMTVQVRTEALRKLSLQVLKLQDIERRRIARELHESVGQDFAGLKLNLDLARRSPDDEKLWARCDELLQHCIDEVRNLSNLLHPPIIEDAGLSSAAEWYVKDFAKRSGITVDATGLEALSRLPESARLVVFRGLQETLMNVHRHARAIRAVVSANKQNNVVTLSVGDDGRGIDRERAEQFNHSGSGLGIGLNGIYERVRELGGRCTICSGQNGTTVSISVPIN